METPTGADHGDIEARLAELERVSDERRRDLREMIAEMPAALSRRALLRAAVGDLRAAPNKGDIVRRGVRKLSRVPSAVGRRIAQRTS